MVLMKDEPSEARASLAKIRDQAENSTFVETEYLDIQRSCTIEIQNKTEGNGYVDCSRGGFNRGSNLHLTAILCTIQMMQQLSGPRTLYKCVHPTNYIVVGVTSSSTLVLLSSKQRYC